MKVLFGKRSKSQKQRNWNEKKSQRNDEDKQK